MMERVLWKEGLFLRPQHFQQQDQLWQQRFARHFELCGGYAWGLTDFALQRNLLSKGEISIERLSGVMPDGTAFELPLSHQVLNLRLEKGRGSGWVYLALPKYHLHGVNIADQGHEQRRFVVHEISVQDELKEAADHIAIEFMQFNFSLQFAAAANDLQAYVVLPVLHVLEVRDTGEIIVDDAFIPPLLRVQVSSQLHSFVKEIAGLLSLRRMKLLDRMSGVEHYGVAGISELLLLQLINRYEPLLEHYRHQYDLHPEFIYQLFLQLAGELRTFTSEDRSYAKSPLYDHLNLEVTFHELMGDLRAAFNYVFDEPAVLIPFTSYKYNLHIANIRERVNFDYQRLVLAVRADVPIQELRHLFPAHAKLGPPDQIKDLVTLQISGIPLQLLPVAPRQIPYHNGFIYFELDHQSEMWLKLKEASALALHLSGNFQNVEVSLWAVKE